MERDGSVVYLDLNLDLDPLSSRITGFSNSTSVALNDIVVYRLRFWQGKSLTRVRLSNGTNIRLGAKAIDPVDTTTLCNIETWVETEDADSFGNFYYEGVVSFATNAARDALTDRYKRRISVNIELSDNLSLPTKNRTIAIFEGSLYADSADGGDVNDLDNPELIEVTNAESPYSANRYLYAYYALDFTDGSIVFNLPSSPVKGDRVRIVDEELLIGTASNSLSIDFSHPLEFEGQYVSTGPVVMDTATYAGVSLFYRFTGTSWKLLSNPITSALVDGGGV